MKRTNPAGSDAVPAENTKHSHQSLGMRILLQNVRNKLFFRCDDVWTADPDAAFDFQRSHDLYDFVEKHQLEDMQLVVKFANPLQFEVVPIDIPLNKSVGRGDPP